MGFFLWLTHKITKFNYADSVTPCMHASVILLRLVQASRHYVATEEKGVSEE